MCYSTVHSRISGPRVSYCRGLMVSDTWALLNDGMLTAACPDFMLQVNEAHQQGPALVCWALEPRIVTPVHASLLHTRHAHLRRCLTFQCCILQMAGILHAKVSLPVMMLPPALPCSQERSAQAKQAQPFRFPPTAAGRREARPACTQHRQHQQLCSSPRRLLPGPPQRTHLQAPLSPLLMPQPMQRVQGSAIPLHMSPAAAVGTTFPLPAWLRPGPEVRHSMYTGRGLHRQVAGRLGVNSRPGSSCPQQAGCAWQSRPRPT